MAPCCGRGLPHDYRDHHFHYSARPWMRQNLLVWQAVVLFGCWLWSLWLRSATSSFLAAFGLESCFLLGAAQPALALVGTALATASSLCLVVLVRLKRASKFVERHWQGLVLAQLLGPAIAFGHCLTFWQSMGMFERIEIIYAAANQTSAALLLPRAYGRGTLLAPPESPWATQHAGTIAGLTTRAAFPLNGASAAWSTNETSGAAELNFVRFLSPVAQNSLFTSTTAAVLNVVLQFLAAGTGHIGSRVCTYGCVLGYNGAIALSLFLSIHGYVPFPEKTSVVQASMGGVVGFFFTSAFVAWLSVRVVVFPLERAHLAAFRSQSRQAKAFMALQHPTVVPELLLVGDKKAAGGAGQVFEGTYSGVRVAIKQLFSSILLSADGNGDADVAELEREAGVLAALRHPGVVQFFGVSNLTGMSKAGDTRGLGRVLVSEWCELDLNRLLHAPTRRRKADDDDDNVEAGPDEEALLLATWQVPAVKLDILRQVTNALAFLHSIHIVHHDIKPENLLIAELPKRSHDGTVTLPVLKICDFGTALRVHVAGAEETGAAVRGGGQGRRKSQVVTELVPTLWHDDEGNDDERGRSASWGAHRSKKPSESQRHLMSQALGTPQYMPPEAQPWQGEDGHADEDKEKTSRTTTPRPGSGARATKTTTREREKTRQAREKVVMEAFAWDVYSWAILGAEVWDSPFSGL